MSPSNPWAWPESRVSRNDPTVAANIARLEAQLQAQQGTRTPFTLDIPRDWHTKIYAGCTWIPSRLTAYVGGYRGTAIAGLRDYVVVFGDDGRGRRFNGTRPDQVEAALAGFEASLQQALVRLDAAMPTSAAATPARLNLLIDDVAKHYAEWLRIHPFVDGNGRTARLLANWLCCRYWQPLIFPGRPPVDRDQLIIATTPALTPPTPLYQPLARLMRNRLVAARKAAMRPAASPPPA